MSGKHLWKLLLTIVIVGISVSYLVPYEDQPFGEYLREKSDSEEFIQLLERAEQRVENKEVVSLYMGLKAIGAEERIDISEYFPEINLEASLRNVEKRNKILLNALLNDSKADLRPGLDIAGGVAMTLQVDPAAIAGLAEQERSEKLSKAIEIIEARVNAYGVSEPVVRAIGQDRIEVQLAGLNLSDNPTVLDDVKRPARLDFREVHLTDRPGVNPLPFGYEIMTLTRESGDEVSEETLYVSKYPALTGKYVEKANPIQNAVGSYEISLNFDSEGAKRFADITTKLAGQGRLAIVLDGKLYSAPNVNEPITGGRASISGSFTQREAIELANVLNNPLEFSLEVAELYEVGPTLAQDSVDSGKRAATWGVCLVAIFMISYYMIGGGIALVSVVLNLAIVLGALASVGATLTLPGIAGVILTIGMAVDANILIFERIREELRSGKTLKSALVGGFDKVFSTIFDANVTTLLVSLVMFHFGTGPVKGFGLTLAIGVVTTMFCALVVSRLLLELLIETNLIKKFPMLSIVNKPKIPFLKFRGPAFATSWLIVIIGVFGLVSKWDSIFGIDFTGGDEVSMSFDTRIDESDITRLIGEQDLGEVTPQYVTPLGGGAEILKLQTPFEESVAVIEALKKGFSGADFEVLGVNKIGPSVGAEIQKNALYAIGISLGLILIYIAIRFEIGYGIGAIVATIHDILLTVGVFVLWPDHQFTAPMIAAILLIVGYSLNDTIVVFDRIREELALKPTAKLYDIINLALNAVLSRSLLTSFTTLLAAGSLMVFGTGVISDIAFTFMIGIITGTFSSIFIASPIFFWWHKGDRRSVETSHDVAPEYDWQAGAKEVKEGK
ncbi:MAG: protein translocase subunit SecD [Opitutaceae bacterium]|nr:protein translocase subunit SecD [Opitutaceae bacterium]